MIFKREVNIDLLLGICIPDSCSIKELVQVGKIVLNKTLPQPYIINEFMPHLKQLLKNLPLKNIEPLMAILNYTSYFERFYNASTQLESFLDEVLKNKIYNAVFKLSEHLCQTKETINKDFSIGDIIVMYVSKNSIFFGKYVLKPKIFLLSWEDLSSFTFQDDGKSDY